MNTKSGIRLVVVVGILGFLLIISTLPSLAQAASPTLPPRPTSVFPSRPAPQPTATPTPTPPSQPAPLGGYIELRVHPAQTGLWTIVQWQDQLGDWHDVEGWQGTLEEDGLKVWWVAPEDLGAGPFRWTVFDSPDGELLATSDPFELPDSAGETVSVEVWLTPH